MAILDAAIYLVGESVSQVASLVLGRKLELESSKAKRIAERIVTVVAIAFIATLVIVTFIYS